MVHTRGPGQCVFVSNYCSKVWVHAPDFRKSGLSKRVVAFRRPCRGLSTWKGASPKELWFYMTRRAVLALRVIPVQGKFDQRWWIKRIQLEVSSGEVFRRFLAIHKFVLNGTSKINYFRSSCVRWFIPEVTANTFSGRILQKRNSNLTTQIDELGARGKPSTYVYRAEWLVEPFLPSSHERCLSRMSLLCRTCCIESAYSTQNDSILPQKHGSLSKTRLNAPKFWIFSEDLIDVRKHSMEFENTP